MDWIKLRTDYPLAYGLMEKDFQCLYTMFGVTPIGNKDAAKITHPLKRDLYDFFDEQKVFVGISHSGEGVQFPTDWDIHHGKQYDSHKVGYAGRAKAETDAFTKAFEILNDQLTK